MLSVLHLVPGKRLDQRTGTDSRIKLPSMNDFLSEQDAADIHADFFTLEISSGTKRLAACGAQSQCSTTLASYLCRSFLLGARELLRLLHRRKFEPKS